LKALPEGIKKNKAAVAETIENNVRKLIIDESPINPKYYEKMSELLDALIAERKQKAVEYAAYLARIVELTRRVKNGPEGAAYPKSLDTPAKKACMTTLEIARHWRWPWIKRFGRANRTHGGPIRSRSRRCGSPSNGRWAISEPRRRSIEGNRIRRSPRGEDGRRRRGSHLGTREKTE